MGTECEKLNAVITRIDELSSAVSEVSDKRTVTLVAVSKNHSPADILKLYECGQRTFGENRVQELIVKIPELPADIRWHFIGRLQKNKVNKVVGKVELIQSVDELDLLACINTRAEDIGIVQDVLLQVNLMKDPSKAGFDEVGARHALAMTAGMKNTNIRGLMTIGPFTENSDEIRAAFSGASKFMDEVSSELTGRSGAALILSMGMTDDMEIAIEEGSTMVRVGRALF